MAFFNDLWLNIWEPIKSIANDAKVVTGTASKPSVNPSGSFMPHPAANGAGISTAKPDPFGFNWMLSLSKAEWQRSEDWLLRKMQRLLSEGTITQGQYNMLDKRRKELLHGEKYSVLDSMKDSVDSIKETLANNAADKFVKDNLPGENVDMGQIFPVMIFGLVILLVVKLFTK